MKALLIFTLLLCPVLGFAGPLSLITDGDSLKRDLETTLQDEHSATGAYTIGWISGLLQGINLGTRQGARPSFRVPGGLPVEEPMKVILKFLREHPDRLKEDPARLADAALRVGYPH